MKPYRFVGSVSEIIGIRLNRFGQKVFLKDPPAKTPVIPEEIWVKIGFTDEEVARYSTPASQAAAPQSFIEKRNKAWCFFQTGKLPPEPAKSGQPVEK